MVVTYQLCGSEESRSFCHPSVLHTADCRPPSQLLIWQNNDWCVPIQTGSTTHDGAAARQRTHPETILWCFASNGITEAEPIITFCQMKFAALFFARSKHSARLFIVNVNVNVPALTLNLHPPVKAGRELWWWWWEQHSVPLSCRSAREKSF